MNPKNPFELLSVASALFPKHLASGSESDQIKALRKTLQLFSLAKDVMENPDADVWEAAQAADAKAERLLSFDDPELLALSKTEKSTSDTPSELAKRVHRKATLRAKGKGESCPNIHDGITWHLAEKLFSTVIKPGRRALPKKSGT